MYIIYIFSPKMKILLNEEPLKTFLIRSEIRNKKDRMPHITILHLSLYWTYKPNQLDKRKQL